MSYQFDKWTDEELAGNYREMQHLPIDVSSSKGIGDLAFFHGLVREMARRFVELIESNEEPEEAANVAHRNGWILLSEQLPEVGKNVLVCDDDGDIYFSHRVNISQDKWAFYNEWGDKIKDLIAWCHLPEPYKAESEET